VSAATDLRGSPPDAATPSGRRRGGARGAFAAFAVAVAAGGTWFLAAGDGERSGAATTSGVPTTTTEVTRRDLLDRQDIEGAITFAGSRTVTATGEGTLTRVRPEGSTVRRGQSLFSIDAEATAFVMYGRVPMYRSLGSGVSDGSDVRQLERNLVALGYDPGKAIEVDAAWDAATTAAVLRWQKDRGVARDGVIDKGEIVFTDGRARVGRHESDVGEPARAGAPVVGLTSLKRVIVGRLPASRQALVRRGDRVRVTLPDGTRATGRVTRVGRVAEAGRNGAEATVELRVELTGRAGRSARLDQAPVTVSITTDTARNVLTVPVTALVATAAGRYAVEVLDGRRRLAPVELGAFADGYVEVSGKGIREGARVVVPR
jgi:peptidoglycan hydrolase-like protein with peptidoglycan-binding domain